MTNPPDPLSVKILTAVVALKGIPKCRFCSFVPCALHDLEIETCRDVILIAIVVDVSRFSEIEDHVSNLTIELMSSLVQC